MPIEIVVFPVFLPPNFPTQLLTQGVFSPAFDAIKAFFLRLTRVHGGLVLIGPA